MFSVLRNELVMGYTLAVVSPLSIRSALHAGLDPVRPDNEVVRDAQGRPYIPGSSLKGVVRSRVEQILRSIDPSFACDPFRSSCGNRHRDVPEHERYKVHCYACRMFGSTRIAARVIFPDAFSVPGETIHTGERTSVGIDRASGGQSRGALFTVEVVEAGRFSGEIRLTNFALWQLMALIEVLRNFNDGYLALGGGTSRGLGRIHFNLGDLRFKWRDFSPQPPETYRGYAATDILPGSETVAWQPDIIGWVKVWQGLEFLIGPGGVLADEDFRAALKRDPVSSAQQAGGRR